MTGLNAALAGVAFVGGTLVGLTGVGGGSLLTPVLILLFGLSPLSAVSNDLVANLVIQTSGAALHGQRRSIDLRLVGWLVVGSVPAAFSGALLLRLIPGQNEVNAVVKFLVGLTLTAIALLMITRYFLLKQRSVAVDEAIRVRPLPTIALGAMAGLLVGLTSIGAGSVIAAGLLMLYPGLSARRLVATDVAHAIPMVGAATLGHLLFGQVHISVALPLIIGGVPGVLLGALLASWVPARGLRGLLGVVLAAAGLVLLRVPIPLVGLVSAALAAGLVVLTTARRRQAAPVEVKT